MTMSYLQKMAYTLVNYSLALKAGERVLLRATSSAAEPLVQAMYYEALKVGAYAFPYLHISNEDSIALEATGDKDLLSAPNPMLKMMYETCDALVRIDAVENTRALSHYPLELQSARSLALSALIGVQMEREGNRQLRRCTTLYPTQGYAQTAGMSLPQYEAFVFGACKLDYDDPAAEWEKLSVFQQRLVDYLKGKKHVHVRGENIDLQLSIEGRLFENANGKSNFPDGEIFTGPVEDSVNGWVKFTYPAYYSNNEVIGAYLRFEDGLVTEARADKNESFLISTLDTDAGSRRLGEFAIGTNQDIQEFTGSILFDEKIGGTVHMALGQGYVTTGSTNHSSIHWDMICDMRQGGQIWVDGVLFYEDGHFKI